MKLVQLNEQEFTVYKERGIKSYSKELLGLGLTQEQANKQAEDTYNRFLPEGINTENHFLNNVYLNEENIGFIWWGIRGEKSAFIYDFYINENHRRKGYGKQVMLKCEEVVKSKGLSNIQLHVFGHNTGARKLYETLGYAPTSIQMRKDL